MNATHRLAAVVAALGLAAVLWSAASSAAPALALVVAAAAPPTAVLLAIWGRKRARFPGRALVGGAVIGPVVAVLSHGLVAAFAAVFLLGFMDAGRDVLHALRLDPRLETALGSPWVFLLLVDLVVVAPLTEEAGKAIGGWRARPSDRTEAFLAGVAAGAGFAVVENLLYAWAAAVAGGPWRPVVLARAMGAAVHPLASGLVVLGWWEWRRDRDLGRLARRFLAGAGVHALWNGTIVAIGVVEIAFHIEGVDPDLGPVALAFAAALGAVLMAVLWRASSQVAGETDPVPREAFARASGISAWMLLAAAAAVPVTLLVLSFPGFVRAGSP